jgi:hypothetical protein
MRDNTWLANRLDIIYHSYFADVPIKNLILVRFGRASRSRFGSIIARPKKGHAQDVTYISINALFRDEVVPEYVIDATLAHEFTHYAHGFHSPIDRKYAYPHKGDIVNKEIRARGAGHLLLQQDAWVKQEYSAFLRIRHLI